MYSGRSENVVDPLLPHLEAAAGMPIEVRYGGTADLSRQLIEEGDESDADIFFAQDAGALGAVEQADLLATLDEGIVGAVPAHLRAQDNSWVATSARARVIVYNSESVTEEEAPSVIDAVLDPRWRGTVGFAPSTASFQSFVTALRLARGEDGARAWLEDFAANAPVEFASNDEILDAVEQGEVELGLTNHYYWYNLAKEGEPIAQVKFLAPGDVGGLVNVAGVGVLGSTDQMDAAQDVVEALLADLAQSYFLAEASEYPVVESVEVADMPQLSELQGPPVDLAALSSLAPTQDLLRDVGLL
jgi:iron(III) transport system substrate-binding protein